ncbi:uncharacterized protein EDB93DRAFT_1152826 [Suillus bovinus]|uniref:uncharacterized protein n=1 Tax=Suillus bovinus TaxID=48563 RepID=UPI001B8603ED|nr:uncharacterized protein EDB93DRAFT_1152826 [Suillus bovinus]KAG2144702.1 hypothetical protein EDB93DRAFT_1152826 [Suillus bovinus]
MRAVDAGCVWQARLLNLSWWICLPPAARTYVQMRGLYDGSLALWHYSANTPYMLRYDACRRCCVDGQASHLPFPLYLLRVLLGLVYSP